MGSKWWCAGGESPLLERKTMGFFTHLVINITFTYIIITEIITSTFKFCISPLYFCLVQTLLKGECCCTLRQLCKRMKQCHDVDLKLQFTDPYTSNMSTLMVVALWHQRQNTYTINIGGLLTGVPGADSTRCSDDSFPLLLIWWRKITFAYECNNTSNKIK